MNRNSVSPPWLRLLSILLSLFLAFSFPASAFARTLYEYYPRGWSNNLKLKGNAVDRLTIEMEDPIAAEQFFELSLMSPGDEVSAELNIINEDIDPFTLSVKVEDRSKGYSEWICQ